MARKSRKDKEELSKTDVAAEPSINRVGIYARLSVEDNGYGTNDSMQNQVALIKEYIRARNDEFRLINVYVDNGTTGTNFERREWTRLIQDIQSGVIDCVIVKDFSRIGRNYIEVGNFLEKVFPFLGTRVIAINENYDSRKETFQNGMLVNSLTNIVNEYYARDISKKVTQTIKTKQRRGEYVNGIVPYGYKKTKDKLLIVDEETAPIVKKIFEWRMQRKSCTAIANYLNGLVIPSPGLYRYMKGSKAFKRSENVLWKTKHVAAILANPLYLGHMVQGKTRCSYFEQGGKVRFLPKEDWIIVKNTHEPLITQEQFEFAANMSAESRKRHSETLALNENIPKVDNPLRDKIFCGQCGGHLQRRSRIQKGLRDYAYYCTSPHMRVGVHCKNTYIHEVPLMEAIQEMTDQYLRFIGIWELKWNSVIYSETNQWCKGHNAQKKRLEDEIALVKSRRKELYADLKEGLLLPPDYEHEKSRLLEIQRNYEIELKGLEEREETKVKVDDMLKQYREQVMSFKNDEIPWEVLGRLIDKITVFSPERIEIKFSFADELCKRMKEVIEC